VKWYADEGAARSAIEDRDIYGAFVVGADGITVLEASAASPSVAQLLSTVGQQLARHAAAAGTAGGAVPRAVQVRDVDAPVGAIGQWLPPGAGANLIRSTAYFDGHGASGHLIVLIAWIVFGLVAVTAGHHAPVRFAARRAWKPTAEIRPDAAVADHGGYDEGALVLAGGTNHGPFG
jgi:hypothetical protein